MKRMLLVVLLMSCGAPYISSLFPVYAEHFNMNNLEITILFAIYALVLLPSLLITGANGDYWGQKKVLRFSILISIASTVFFILSVNIWMLYFARVLEGIAYGVFTGVASAYLLKQTALNKTESMLKISGAATNLGFGLGPAICGLTIQYLHFAPLRMPFWILLGMLLFSSILLEFLPNDDNRSAEKRKISMGIPKNMTGPFWSFIALPIFALFTLAGVALSLIPLFVRNVMHSSNLSISGLLILLLLGGGSMLQFFPWPAHPVVRMRISILALIIGSWIIGYSGEISNLPLLWVGILLEGLGSGWTFQAALRFSGELPKPEECTRVITAFYICAYAGFIIPPVTVGLLTLVFQLNTSLMIINAFASIIIIYVLAYSVRFNRYYASVVLKENSSGRIVDAPSFASVNRSGHRNRERG
ncbi:MFS transporter [Paenibacillus glycinis]|uniref:MFS transporter n=1 Tax=Paenibacillus glycinis TaxID=2697035 RepID=A0ABW9XQV3_9BACL|nr:MFS transporter [Paenibacillus glycinis]NBD25024.1 MFS transporter [Paenibacillus glycinis]